MSSFKVCNMCGKSFGEWDYNSPVQIENRIGYGSKYNCMILEFDLCNDCMDALIDKCKVSPIKEHKQEYTFFLK